jgi:hypothetical protein
MICGVRVPHSRGFLAHSDGDVGLHALVDAILGALADGDLSGARLGAFGPRFVAGMDAMRVLVHTFYNPNFRFSKFIRRFPECRHDLIRVLRGDVFDHDFSTLFAALAATAAPDSPGGAEFPAAAGSAVTAAAVTGDRR